MANPVEEYQAEKLGAKEQRKQHELDLWHTWKNNGQKPEHLQPLLKLYAPVISQHVRKHKVLAIPDSALEAEVVAHTIKAFQSYDPGRGAALNTWVEQRLPKVGRYRNKHQNMAYIPEGQAGQIGKLTKARDELREELGRDPTHDEIGNHIGMPEKRVSLILKAVRNDIPMGRSAGADQGYDYSVGSEPTGRGFEDQQIAVAANILPEIFPNKPEVHELFHYTFGTNGYPQVRSTGELAKRMGKSQSQVSRMKTMMGATLQNYMGTKEAAERQK